MSRLADVDTSMLLMPIGAVSLILIVDYAFYKEFATSALGYGAQKSMAIAFAAIVIAKLAGKLMFYEAIKKARQFGEAVQFKSKRSMIGLSILMALSMAVSLFTHLGIKGHQKRIQKQQQAVLLDELRDGMASQGDLFLEYTQEEVVGEAGPDPLLSIQPIPSYLIAVNDISTPVFLLLLGLLPLVASGYFLTDIEILLPPISNKRVLSRKREAWAKAFSRLDFRLRTRDNINKEMAKIEAYKAVLRARKRDYYTLN